MTPSPLELASGRVRVCFTLAGDRWHHRVATPAGEWASLEGTAAAAEDPRWPPSPVLAELSRLAVEGGEAILGVGRAGRSHFSLAVRWHPHLADTLLFEAACRIVEPALRLGSSYRAADGTAIWLAARVDPPPATICWTYRIGPGGIEPEAGAAAAAPG